MSPRPALLLLLAACPSQPPASEPGATTGAASTSALTPTTTAITTGELDCGALTRCGVTCVDIIKDINNCGDCGISCRIDHAVAECTASNCLFVACEPGRVDCDEDLANGCETPGSTCPLVCAPDDPELCNLFDDDCDGACDPGVAGCRRSVHRALSPTLGRLYTLDPREAASADYSVEALAYYNLYTAAMPGTVPFWRCLLPDGQHYYTTSETCDGFAAPEGVLGHIAQSEVCGAVPLYRLSNGPMINYLYTHDPAERDDAIANQGYLYEAIAGHVWLTP